MVLERNRIYADRTTVCLVGLVRQLVVNIDPNDECAWVLDPPFQRGAVWTLSQKQQWWETILADIPAPAIFVNRFGANTSFSTGPKAGPPGYENKEIVVNGQQRIRAIAEFLQDEFPVRGEYWSDQPGSIKRDICNMWGCPLLCTKYNTMKECAELYLRLLQTGTAHTPEEIAKAEDFVRNVDNAGLSDQTT